MSTSIDYDSKKEDPNAYYAQEGVVEPVVLEDANPASPHYAVKRVMTTRQIQFYAIGGTIGTAVFVSIGANLLKSGPLFLLLGYIIWCSVIYCVNEGQGIMVSRIARESAFTRFATSYVDEAFGFATGVNYFIQTCSLLCFEVTALHGVIGFWYELHPAIMPCICLVAYFSLHVWSSRWFAESEFWIVLGKIILMIMLFMFTFVTMVGGNPLKDAYGFRYWKNPGPISEYYGTGHSAQLRAFLASILGAAFAVAGPDMLSLISAEAINPRKVLPGAFRSVYVRLIIFFLASALAVGIVVGSEDEILTNAVANGLPGAGRSPYVAAMTRMKIGVLPHIVNAGIASSIFSAGSAFLFGASRTLHGLALDGYAPKFLRKTNKNGVPHRTVFVVLAVMCLSFLQVSAGSTVVLDWFINISTSSQIVTWMAMSVTFIRFHKACKLQGVSMDDMPYRSRLQPYAAWYALSLSSVVLLINGYPVFLKGNWSTPDFIFAYAAPIIFVIAFIGWKAIHRKRWVDPNEAQLYEGLEEIEAHEEELALLGLDKEIGNKWYHRLTRWLF